MILEVQIVLDCPENWLKVGWFSGEQDDENDIRLVFSPGESGKSDIELGHTNLETLKMLVNLIETSTGIVK